jgi:hypothetical protein
MRGFGYQVSFIRPVDDAAAFWALIGCCSCRMSISALESRAARKRESSAGSRKALATADRALSASPPTSGSKSKHTRSTGSPSMESNAIGHSDGRTSRQAISPWAAVRAAKRSLCRFQSSRVPPASEAPVICQPCPLPLGSPPCQQSTPRASFCHRREHRQILLRD